MMTFGAGMCWQQGGREPSACSTVRSRRRWLAFAGGVIRLGPLNASTQHDPEELRHAAADRPGRPVFVTTHWSVVITASRNDTTRAQDALERLCRTYWYPLYAFVRRQGHAKEDAEDLTQEFFARLLHKEYLQDVSREKGRFRTFLLVALKRFLANEWDRVRAQKRGGGERPLSLDAAFAEKRYEIEPVDRLSADRIYERRWALTLIEQAIARLRGEFEEAGKLEEFHRLKAFLAADRNSVPYAEVAAALGQTEGAVRVAVHRMRKRFRELFREEISHTVASADEIEEEVKHLMTVLAG